jgi:hypothetical protein
MANILEGIAYNTVCKTADTQEAKERDFEVMFGELTEAYKGTLHN